MKNILIVDDDKEIQKALSIALQQEEFAMVSAFTIKEAVFYVKEHLFDLILLDIMLPDGNGFDLLQIIREQKIYVPVICLSSKDDEAVKVAGLGIGADDYITKPFSISLLKSKIKALIRRNTLYSTSSNQAQFGDFTLDRKQMDILYRNKPLELTAKEFHILSLFLEHPHQVFTKEQIYKQVWNNDVVDDNTITVYIKRLREKIEVDSSHPQFLLTVWGIGYKFEGK